MSYSEAHVRDSLSLNLGLIEDGLRLVETERHLPNAVGARGFVDVFARDRFGNFVVIEVKRADQTARHALHEILKYAELLQREHGIPAHRLRLMIASTAWHELTVPFSALVRFCPYPLDGFALTVTDDGAVAAVNSVSSLPPSVRGRLSRDSIILLCRDAATRDRVWTDMEPHFGDVGLDDVIGIALDYAGPNADVIWRHGLAVIPGQMPLARAREVGLLQDDESPPTSGRRS